MPRTPSQPLRLAGLAILCALAAGSCGAPPGPVAPAPPAGAPDAGLVEPVGETPDPLLIDGEPRPVKREVVFLLDLSESMPDRLGEGRFEDFPAVVRAAQAKAREMLEPYRDDEHLTVSFYQFGDIAGPNRKGEWTPNLRKQALGLSAAEAIARLDEFFLTDPKKYEDGWTYVAAAVYEIAHQRLDLGGPCDAIQADEEKPLLTLFALTDLGTQGGGESSPSCTQDPERCTWDGENQRRIAWLERQQLTNALSYTHWDMGHDSLELIPPDQAVYRVQWISKDKGQFNLGDPDLLLTQTLDDFEPRIRLLPEAAQPSQQFLQAHPELVCQPRRVAALVESPPGRRSVDVLAGWNTSAGTPPRDPLDGLNLVSSRRRLRPDGRGIDLTTLRADLVGRLELPLPVHLQPLVGDHPLRLTPESLCAALTDQYPNSTFLLPPDLDGSGPATGGDCDLPERKEYALARIGRVALVDEKVVPTYRFTLTGDAVSLDAPVVLGVDRWWRAVPDPETAPHLQERSVVLGYTPPPTEPAYRARYELQLLRDGVPLDRFFDDVLSFGDGATRLEDVPAGQPVTVRFPGRPQHWYTFGHTFPAGDHPGRYQARICAQPIVDVAGPHHVEVSCQAGSCGAGGEQAYATDEPLCAALEVQVGARPWLPWWWIIAFSVTAASLLYAAVCWLRRQRFPDELVVGTDACRLRYEHEENPLFQPTRRIRAFLHALTWPKAGPIFYIEISDPKQGAVQSLLDNCGEKLPLLGIRPLSDGAVAIWLVRTDANYRLILRNPGRDELPPRGCTPPEPFGPGARLVRVPTLNSRVRLDLESDGTVRATLEFRHCPRETAARGPDARRLPSRKQRPT